MKRAFIGQLMAQTVNMGDIWLQQALPMGEVEQVSPYLLLHHADLGFEEGSRQKEKGVGSHPHRGFIPVTFVIKGEVHHRDSMNNSDTVSSKGIQWMHSGKGVVHSERPSQALLDEGGNMEIIQLWVNVPQKYKMTAPKYMPLQANQIPTWRSGNSEVQVAAGVFNGLEGPLPTYSPMNMLRADIKSEESVVFDLPETHNVMIYQIGGEGEINGELPTKKHTLSWADPGQGTITIAAEQDSAFLVLSGEPIEEPLVTHGPFVMNSEVEIMHAMKDYQSGKMGFLVEEFG